MKLTELLFQMLQEVIVTPQAEHYPKFRYYITNLLERVHSAEQMTKVSLCDCCQQETHDLELYPNWCEKCKKLIDICEACLIKGRTKFGVECTCAMCKK